MPATLLLVDATSYLIRAFHERPSQRGPGGDPAGALYGMVAMLRELRDAFRGAYLACVFNGDGLTFRHALHAPYKAAGGSLPDDLLPQLQPVRAAAQAMGWPVLAADDIDAHDVIATLCQQAEQGGIEVLISSAERSLAQLVNSQVSLINSMTGEKLDVPGVQARLGVAPERVADYLALIGDTVANVPGVAKCGPRTALKWLAQYQTLDELMASAGEISGPAGDNLRQALDWLPTARMLATLRRDCDLASHLTSISASLTAREADLPALAAMYERYGFDEWRAGMAAQAPAVSGSAGADGAVARGIASHGPSAANGPSFDQPRRAEDSDETVTTASQLDRWLALIGAASLTALEISSSTVDPMNTQLTGIGLSVDPDVACHIPLAPEFDNVPGQLPREAVLEALRPWLEDAGRLKVCHDLKYLTHVLANHDIALRGMVHDTLLQSYVFESHRAHDPDALVARHLSRAAASAAGLLTPAILPAVAGAGGAAVTLRLHRALSAKVGGDASLAHIYRSIEIPTAAVLQRIERNGVLVDAALLRAQSAALGLRIAELERCAHQLAGGTAFNLGSPKDVGGILFEQLKMPVLKKTPGGMPSTDEEVLQKLAEDYPLPKVLLEYRSLSKLKSSYADKLPTMINRETGRVHTNYAQAVAVTGRLASNDPNLQNIPIRTSEGRRIREAFIAPPGSHIVSADYSQIELRIMAHISGDENMLRAFSEGVDIHRATAAEIFGVPAGEVSSEQRRYAKVINFGLIYGMSAFGLAGNLGIERDAAQRYIERYFARFPGVVRYMEDTRRQAKARGYVETLFGRRLWLPEINSPNRPRRQGAERAAINAPMQGTAADLIKLAMIAVQVWLESAALETRMIMQVHDELVLEVPDHELVLVQRMLPELMAGVADLKVPLVAEVGTGTSWLEAH